MSDTRRNFLRDVMAMAWSFYRSGPASGYATFAKALSGAWAWFKGREARRADNAAWLARVGGRTVAFGSMVQSPIRRSLSGAYAGARLRAAGYVTSAVGR